MAQVSKSKAAKMVQAGEGVMRFKPTHPMMNRDLYYATAEGANAKLDAFCREYGDDRALGSVVTLVATETAYRDTKPGFNQEGRIVPIMRKATKYFEVR